MKIAFCGDSFCSETWEDTWCGIVSKHFAASIIPLGQNGSNEYAILQRFKKLISKKLKLGRLESSEEFKEKKSKQKRTEEFEIEKLKITVRDLNKKDISSRNLKITKGVVITEISSKSPLSGQLNINDIIIEAKRTPITKSSDLKNLVDKIIKQGDKNLLLSIIDSNNRRRYIGIKLN